MTDSVRPNFDNPMTILLIDDDPSTLLVCRMRLQQQGFRVLQVPGSSEALKLQAEHAGPIHLVITDIMLPPPDFQLSVANNPFPRVNGLELADRLLEAKADLRIILMSTTSKEDLLARGMIRKSMPFIQKPFTVEAFSSLIYQTLAGPPAPKNTTKKDGSGTAREVDWFG
ncbi:response regulator [Nitrospira sp. Nam80]